MSYRVAVSPRAAKELRKLPKNMIPRLKEAVTGLSHSPRPVGARKLVNVNPETWRIRIGNWRALYHIDDASNVVTVIHVFHRREAYRK